MAHDLIRPQTDGMLFKAIVPDLLYIFLGHDDPCRGRSGAIEGHEVGPGLMQLEAHRARIHRLNVFHLRLEFPSTYAPVACEAKDHIVSGAGITVVEFETRAQ